MRQRKSMVDSRSTQVRAARHCAVFWAFLGVSAVSRGADPVTLGGHTDFVRTLQFSPDGRTLASGADDHAVRLWDAVTGKHKSTLTGHKTWQIWAMSFSDDGRTLATMNGLGSECFLWDVASGKKLVAFDNEQGWSPSLVFSPDGKTLASGTPPLAWITFWDPKTGLPGRQFQTDRKTEKRAVGAKVAFLPGGKSLAAADDAGFLRLWDVATGNVTRKIEAHGGEILSLAVSRDGTKIVTGGADRRVRVWNAATGENVATFPFDEGTLETVFFSPDGKSVASADNRLRVWDLASGKATHTIARQYNVALSRDWKLCATTDSRTTIRVRPLKEVLASKPEEEP